MSIKWDQLEAFMRASEKPKRQLTQFEEQLEGRRNGCGPIIGTFLLPAVIALGLLAGGCSADELPPTNDEAITCYAYGEQMVSTAEHPGIDGLVLAIGGTGNGPGDSVCWDAAEEIVNARLTQLDHISPYDQRPIPQVGASYNLPAYISTTDNLDFAFEEAQ